MVAIELVQRHRQSEFKPKSRGSVDTASAEAFIRRRRGSPFKGDKALVEALYSRCRDLGCWLACNCNPAGRPALYAICSRGKTLYEARLSGRCNHHASCPLFNVDCGQKANPRKGQLASSTQRPQKPWSPEPPKLLRLASGLNLPQRRNEEQQSKHDSAASNERFVALPAALKWFLELARLNDLPATGTDGWTLLRMAGSVPMSAGYMRDYVLCSLSAYRHGYYRMSTRLAAKHGFEPYCFLICNVTSVRVDGLTLVDPAGEVSIRLEGHPYVFGGIEARRGPFIGILKIDANGVARQAYLHPSLSAERYCLVDSALERLVIFEIFRIKNELEAIGVCIQIKKPFYPLTDSGIVPDVLLRIAEKTVAIEVLGYGFEMYLSRKESQAIQLLSEGTLYIAVKPGKDGSWRKTLKQDILNCTKNA